jgi:hypothetical protein
MAVLERHRLAEPCRRLEQDGAAVERPREAPCQSRPSDPLPGWGVTPAGRARPLDEAAHRRLMLAYARAGRRGFALRQFLACRRALVDELGVEPAAETSELQRRILAGEPV